MTTGVMVEFDNDQLPALDKIDDLFILYSTAFIAYLCLRSCLGSLLFDLFIQEGQSMEEELLNKLKFYYFTQLIILSTILLL